MCVYFFASHGAHQCENDQKLIISLIIQILNVFHEIYGMAGKNKNKKQTHTQSIITRWPHNLSSKPGHFESDRDTINNYDRTTVVNWNCPPMSHAVWPH